MAKTRIAPWVGLAALASLFLLPKGSGGSGSTSTPGGGIGQVVLSQGLSKKPGETLTIAYSLTFGTKDFQGQPISWPYTWEIQFIEIINGLFIGGQIIPSVVHPDQMVAPGTQNFTDQVTIPASVEGKVFGPLLVFRVRTSDSVGQPTPLSSGTTATRLINLQRAADVTVPLAPPLATCTRPSGTIGVGRTVYRNGSFRADITSLRRTASNNAWSVNFELDSTRFVIFDSDLVGNFIYEWAKDSSNPAWRDLWVQYHSVPFVTIGGPGAFIEPGGLLPPVFPGDPAHPTCPGGYA